MIMTPQHTPATAETRRSPVAASGHKTDHDHILRERAAALARRIDTAEDVGNRTRLLAFALGGERYAVESRYVSEVYSTSSLTPLPCTPAFICGIINVRGRIVSVVDLSVLFAMPAELNLNGGNVVLLASDESVTGNGSGREFGIFVDAVIGVRDYAPREFQSQLPVLPAEHSHYMKAVTNEQVLVLDARALLTDRKLIVNEP